MRRRPLAASSMDMRAFEEQAYRRGFQRITGIDEAGRGPLAGPVVAAAVVLPPDLDLPEVTDSKKLSAAQRESCYEQILSCADDVGVGLAEAAEIDRINVLRATFRAMVHALQNLRPPPDFVLIDGPYSLPVSFAQQGIPGGDQRSLSIAAASIVAKVHRDRLMADYHRLYPAYGFDRHKGYPTAEHLRTLREFGPCPIHRLSFRGVVLSNEGGVYSDSDSAREGKKGRRSRC